MAVVPATAAAIEPVDPKNPRRESGTEDAFIQTTLPSLSPEGNRQ